MHRAASDKIATKAQEQKANYLLAVKGHQPFTQVSIQTSLRLDLAQYTALQQRKT